eukprot:COSAG06_NODE_281_length_18447_cov_14.060116_3_plen_1764_part_00
MLKKIGTDDSGLPAFEPKIVAALWSHEFQTDDGQDEQGWSGWIGTYQYMSPEATFLNAKEGYPKGRIATKLKTKDGHDNPLFGASDSFSFGMMLFIMMTRDLHWWETDNLELPIITEHGERKQELKTVARWYYGGTRPTFVDSFPPLLRLLIESCWADSQSDRPRFVEIEALLKNSEIDWLAVTLGNDEEQETTYDGFLTQLGLMDREADLANFLSNPGEELTELLQMDEQDLQDDILDDPDLGFSEETKARFQAAVANLREPSGAQNDGGQTTLEKLLALLPASESLTTFKGTQKQKLCDFVDQEILLVETRQTTESLPKQLTKTHVTRELICSFADRVTWSDREDLYRKKIPELVSYLYNPQLDPDQLFEVGTDQGEEASGQTAMMVLAQCLLNNTPAGEHMELNESIFTCILDLIDSGGDPTKEDDDNQTVVSTLQWKNPRDLTIVKVQLWAKHFGCLRNLPCAHDDYNWLAKVYMLKKLKDWAEMDEWDERSADSGAPKSDQELQFWCHRISNFRTSGDIKFTSERMMNQTGRKLLLKILVGEDKVGINLANVPPMDKVGWKIGSETYCSCETFVTAIQAITHGIPSFHLDPSDKHQSATCVVVDAGRIYDRFISEEKVVVKFMKDKEQYDCEVDVREQLLAKQASDTKRSSHLRPINDCIVPIESHFIVDQDSLDNSQMWRSLVQRSPRLKNFGKHVLIMPRGLRDLMDVLSHDRVAGHDEAAVSRYGRDIAICLLVMESLGYSHGDVKLLNVMIFQASTKQQRLKLIDLDAAVPHDDPTKPAGMKLSTACVPPEVARLVVRYREMRLNEPTLEAEPDRIIEPSDDWDEWRKWLVAQPDKVLAKPTFDIWSFGTALYRLCVQDGVDLFLTSQADNIVEPEDLRQLAFEWDSVKLDKLSKINWPAAYDLILWCLEANPERRPQSFEEVLAHPFFQAPSLACCPVGPEYSSIHPFDPRVNGQYFYYQYRPGGDTERAQDLHRAVESKDVRIVSSVLQRGGIHADILTNPSTGVTALHRAARNASVEIFMVLVQDGGNVNARTKFGFTCLHWAVAYSQWKMVKAMLSIGSCDTTAKNERGKTPWDLADAVYSASCWSEDSASVQADLKKKLRRLARMSEEQFGNEAELPETGADTALSSSLLVLATFERAAKDHAALATEKQRRKMRPHVPDNFRDDIELDHERFDFWTIESFSNWKLISNAGGFSNVYEPLEVSPWIQVSDGRRFGGKNGLKIAVKVPKGATLRKLEAASDDLKTEVESLAQLTHVNVVQILGMFQGCSPGTTRTDWKMALEFCSSDLNNMLHKRSTEAGSEYSCSSIELMLKFLKQILSGLTYIHGQQTWHLDLKSENILLNKDGPDWICKIGDFGMKYTKESTKEVMDSDSDLDDDDAEPVAETPLADPASSSASASIGKALDPEDKPYGTWEYMPPECTPRAVGPAKGPRLTIRSEERSHYGRPEYGSDIFSLGILFWEMIARARPYTGFAGFEDEDAIARSGNTVFDEKLGKDVVDVRKIAARLATGSRPAAPPQCPPLLYMLMQCCWVPGMAQRPTASAVEQIAHVIANFDGALDAPASAASREQLDYDRFLALLGLQEHKGVLADYIEAGKEIVELAQMDADDLNDDVVDDLQDALATEEKAILLVGAGSLAGLGASDSEQQVFLDDFRAHLCESLATLDADAEDAKGSQHLELAAGYTSKFDEGAQQNYQDFAKRLQDSVNRSSDKSGSVSTLKSVDMDEAWKRLNEVLESDVALDAGDTSSS